MDSILTVNVGLEFVFYFFICDFFVFLGIFERQWYPVLQGLKSYVDSPGVAYSDIMQDFLPDTNDALRTRNARLLQFLSKLSADLYEKQLPYIHNVKLRALYVQGITGNRQLAQQLKCGQVNLNQLNNYIAQAYNGFIDFLNSQPQ